MDISRRQRLYKEAVEQAGTAGTKFSDAFGVSNSAKIIERGLMAFNVNFDRVANDIEQVVVHCLLRFPPEDEIYFSLFIKSEINVFRQRLEEMRMSGSSRPRGRGRAVLEDEGEEEDSALAANTLVSSPDGLDYTDNNKNVKGYIGQDGRLYLRNKGYWDSMPVDLSTISNSIKIDRVLFSIWPPTPSARRSLLAREFIGYLGSLIGHEVIHELQVWPDVSIVSPEMRRLPHTIPVAELVNRITELGGHYPRGEIQRFHAASNFRSDKHFVILSGLSGTGKTQLATHYARAVHGIRDRVTPDPFLFVCPVRPEWTDPSGLTGYYDVLSNRYMVPPFLEAVLVAIAHRESPVFVVLDEMNLARVEYYFSDVLSCIETGEPLQLHSSSVPLEGSTGTSIRAALPIPPNLYIIGTINIDETTNPVSDKVLDRAVVIDMASVDMPGYLQGLSQRETDLQAAVSTTSPLLTSVHQALDVHRLGFGYRVAKEVVMYQAFAAEHLSAPPEKTLDDLMVQKILVKLRGSEKQRPLLSELSRLLKDMPRSQAFLEKLTGDLNDFGSFQASR